MNAQPAPAGRRMLILAILLLAFGLRCAGLDAQELRGDEAFGYFFSLPTLDAIVERTLDLGEPHPVASYWLQHLWLGVAGHSEFALRFTGVWWSVLAAALVLPLARQLALPMPAGITAAALMALSPYTIWHAQDARMYSMSLALTIASTLLTVCWWRGESRSRQLCSALGYLLVTWLALHTHYFALYIVVAQNVATFGWAIAERAWSKLAVWWGIGVLILLTWFPWLLVAWAILLDYHGNGDSPGLLDALVRAHSAYGVGESVPHQWQWAWALLMLAAVALGALALWQMSKKQRATLWFLGVYWLAPLAATWLIALNRPIFNERYLVAAVPPVYLLIAAAVGGQRATMGARGSNWVRRGVVALIMVGMALGVMRQVSDPIYSKTRGWRELAVVLEQLAAGVEPERVRLVQNYPDPTLWYYYQGDVAHLVLPPAPHDAVRATEEVNRLVADGVERVVLVEQPADSWDANGVARSALRGEYALAGMITVANWPLSIWLRAPTALETMRVEYEGGLQLRGAQITPTTLPAAGVVEVYLHWQGSAEIVGEQEAVSVQLLNEAGLLVSQSDRPLEMASDTTARVASYVILLPATLAAGNYHLAVVVYDPGLDGSPRRLTVQGADSVRLGSVTVLDAK